MIILVSCFSSANMAIPSNIIFIAVSYHLEHVIIKILILHFFTALEVLNYELFHHSLWVAF